MKNLLLASFIVLVSCQKTMSVTEDVTPIDSTPVASSMTFVDSVWYLHTVVGIGGKYQDTSAFMQQSGLSLLAGDSWYENMVWTGSWWTNNFANPNKAFTRGIGGQTHASYKRFIDSSVRYLPKLSKVLNHFGINEAIQYGNMTLEKEPAFLLSIEQSARDYYNHLVTKLPGLQYNIQQFEPSPKLYQMGYKNTIVKVNQIYKKIADSLLLKGHKVMIIKTHDLLLTAWGTPDSSYFKSEGSRGMYHLNTAGYDRIKAVMKASISGYFPDTPQQAPLPIPTEDVIINLSLSSKTANGTYTFSRSSKYFPDMNANATKATSPASYIKAFSWTYVSGPIDTVTFTAQNSGRTKILPTDTSGYYLPGEYKFKVIATDNLNRTGSAIHTVTISNN